MVSCSLSPLANVRINPALDGSTLAGRLLQQIPLSSTYTDQDGNTTCLYNDTIHGIVGNVWYRNGASQIFQKTSIFNGLTQKPLDERTISRIKTSDPDSYVLVCESSHTRLFLWPKMVAAAKGDQFLKDSGFQDHHIFPQEIFSGKLTNRTEEEKRDILRLRQAFNQYGIEQECPDNYIPLPSKRTLALPEDRQRNLPYQGSYHSGKHEVKYIMKMVEWAHQFLEENKEKPHEQIRQRFWAVVQATWVPALKNGSISLNQKGREVFAEQQKQLFQKEMQERTQQHGLTESFNSCHPRNVMPAKPHTPPGQIGGVGLHAGEIEDLFSEPESLLEDEHIIAVPCTEGCTTPPFSPLQLQQLVRELIIGIYDHDTIPFFSLDFNNEGNLVPLLHPIYENTLVGKVISLLDYFMKGYLNGGVFDEKFLLDWQKHKEKTGPEVLDKIIDFKKYIEENRASELPYVSLRQLFIALQMKEQEDPVDPFSLEEDCLHMRSSFRIIAKQQSIKKHENLFVLDPDFDVEYTLEPDPVFREKVHEMQTSLGCEPKVMTRLKQAYKLMCHRIKQEMPKLPLCKELFSMLGVISFLSHYLSSLKAHGKIPKLAPTSSAPVTTLPLLPSLPLHTVAQSKFSVSFFTLFQSLYKAQKWDLGTWFQQGDQVPLPPALLDVLSDSLKQQAVRQLPRPLKVACENPNNRGRMLRTTSEYFQLLRKVLRPQLQKDERYNFFNFNLLGNYQEKIKNIELPFTADILALASELAEKEQQAIKNVVGGCGLRFASLHAEHSSQAARLMSYNALSSQSVPEGDWQPLFSEGLTTPVAFACKISFGPIEEADSHPHFQKIMPEGWIQAANCIQENEHEALLSIQMPSADWLTSDDAGNTLLHIAASCDQNNACKILLQKGLSASQGNKHGQTPVHLACAKGALFSLESLIESCSESAQKPDVQGQMPLHLAVRHDQLPCIHFLFRQNVPINCPTIDDTTPLLLAFHHEYWPIVQELIMRPGIDLEASLANGQTPLHEAVACRQPDIVKLLLEKGARHSPRRKDGFTPLLLAALLGEKEICELLCTHGADATASLPNKETTLHLAIRSGSLPLVQFFRQKDVSLLETLSETRCSVVLQAILLGEQEIALYILTDLKGIIRTSEGLEMLRWASLLCNSNDEEITPIQAALEMQLYDVIYALLDEHVPLPTSEQLIPILAALPSAEIFEEIHSRVRFSKVQKEALLLLAPQYGNQELIAFLLSKMDTLTQHQLQTLFESCVTRNIPDIAIFLAQTNGFLIEQCYDGKGMHALAASSGSVFLLRWALTHHFSETAVRQAMEASCQNNQLACVDVLLPHIHSLSVPLNSRGSTALHIAAEKGYSKLFELLLTNGCSYLQPDQYNKNVLDYAVTNSHKDIVTRLLRLHCPTTLQQLCQATDMEILQQLLESKEWTEEELAQTCVHCIDSSNLSKLQFLLTHGVRGDVATSDQWTPLTYAAAHGKEEELALLIPTCSTLFHFTKGKNAFHHAVLGKQYHCLKLLQGVGFDIHTRDAQGKTAVELAGNCTWLVQYLGNPVAFEIRIRKIQQVIGHVPPLELKKCAEDLLDQDFFLSQNGTYCPLFLAAISHLETLDLATVRSYVQAFQKNAFICDRHGQNLSHLLASREIAPLPEFNPSLPDKEGSTALHIYAAQEDPQLLDTAISLLHTVDPQDSQGITPLHISCTKGLKENVELLIKANSDVNTPTKMGFTPLWIAASQGDLFLAKKLVQHGARVENQKHPILLTALENGHEEMAFFLARHGASIYEKDSNGVTAVHLASSKGLLSFLRYLHERSMSWMVRTNSGLLPVHFAALSGQAEAIKIVGKPSYVRESCSSQDIPPPQAMAAESGLLAPLQALSSLEYDTEISLKGREHILPYAVRSGVQEQLEHLLSTSLGDDLLSMQLATLTAIVRDDVKSLESLQKKGILFNLPLLDGRNALHWACHYGSVQTALFLLDSGAKSDIPDTRGNLPIHIAAEKDRPTLLQHLLLRAEIGPSDDRKTLLHRAAAKGCTRNVLVLLDARFSIHAKDVLDNTPLHEACRSGNSFLIELLLFAGADYEARTLDHKRGDELIPVAFPQARKAWDKLVGKIGQNPTKNRLHLAIEHGYNQHLPVLAHICDINAIDENGDTPLHLAVQKKDHHLVRNLLQGKAQTEIKNKLGFTPLWTAACDTQDRESVRLLLFSHANKLTTNLQGKQLLEAARGLITFDVLQ